MRTLIKDTKNHIGNSVTIAGWVDVRRDHGKLIFLDVRDRTGIVQVVSNAKNVLVHAIAESLGNEWVIQIEGVVNRRPESMVNPDQETGEIEIAASNIIVLGKAAELPFEKDSELNLDTHLDHMPLTLRSARSRAIFKVQAHIIAAYRAALVSRNFVEFQSPKLVGSDAEGGGEVFKVDYFHDKSAYLATSPQLYKQIMAGIFERVFTTGNVYRAEKHSTTRHLSEYTSLDAEFGFIEDYEDIMEMLTSVMHDIIAILKEKNSREFEFLGASFPLMLKKFPALKLREAQRLIKEETGEDCTKEPDLAPAHEKFLSEYAAKNLNSDFIFITHYPVEKRPFYTHEDENDLGFTKSFDLLFRGVEIATGGRRVHDYETLIQKLKYKKLNPKDFSFYLQAFKYGMPPHGGWGMGLERLTQKFLGLANVKEATLFPREINRIDTLLSQ